MYMLYNMYTLSLSLPLSLSLYIYICLSLSLYIYIYIYIYIFAPVARTSTAQHQFGAGRWPQRSSDRRRA